MRKKTLLLVFIICLFFSSCKIRKDFETSYEFLNDISKIDTIEIIKVVEFDELYEDGYEVAPNTEIVLEITDKIGFLEGFNSVQCYMLGYPHAAEGVSVGERAIKIIYNNDEYEIIGVDGQGHYTHREENVGGEWCYHNFGFYYFNEQEFNALIDKYMK